MKPQTKRMVVNQVKIFGACVLLAGLPFLISLIVRVIGEIDIWDTNSWHNVPEILAEWTSVVPVYAVIFGCWLYGLYHWLRFAQRPAGRANLGWRPIVAKEWLLLLCASVMSILLLPLFDRWVGGSFFLCLYVLRSSWWAIRTLRTSITETAMSSTPGDPQAANESPGIEAGDSDEV